MKIQLVVAGALVLTVWATSIPLRNVKNDAPGTSSSALTWRVAIPVVVIGVLPMLHPHLTPHTLPHPLPAPFTQPGSPVRILSSVDSLTGRIVVGESLPRSALDPSSTLAYPSNVRYLRAAHSLIGGVWIGDQVRTTGDQPPIKDASGQPLGDSVYSTFVLQEGVRLIDKKDRQIPETGEKALIMYGFYFFSPLCSS